MGKAKTKDRMFTYKRCPHCFTNMRLDVNICHSCHKKVGRVDRYGLAKKPVNVAGYLAAMLWIGIFAGYIWFAFIK